MFFAGHGVQIKTGNYLLPVDIEASSESEIEKTAYSLADLTDKLSDAKASFALVLVDACRDNPIKSKGRSVGGSRGLSAIEPPKGQIVVFSASKGQQALDRLSDNDNNPNGVFTREFIKRMKQPGVRIEDMMREVQDSVETLAQSISHDQRPAVYNEARGNFYFFGPTTVQVQRQTPSPATDPEIQTWLTAERVNTPASYQAYLDTYPKGRYVPAAKIAMDGLKQAAARPNAVPVKPRPGTSDDPDTSLWKAVESGNTSEDYGVYLRQYPKGKYVALARQRSKRMEDESRAKTEADDQTKQDAARQQREQREAAQREEQDTWRQAESATDSATVQRYLDRYPNGPHAGQARTQLAAVKKAESEMRPGKVFKDCPECPEMVALPAGSFQMGSNEHESEKPIHGVSIRSFAMGKTEVTRGQFATFVAATGHNAGNSCWTLMGTEWKDTPDSNWRNPGFSQADSDPAACINWDDAQAYVKWISQKTGKGYHLPSEAQWEYACRAGANHTYCGSDNVDSVAVYGRKNGDRTLPVASKQANAWGLFDMSGNVWEWKQDCWNANYTGSPGDGGAWTAGNCGQRVMRGGSWNSTAAYSRAEKRSRVFTTNRSSNDGFRLARMLP